MHNIITHIICAQKEKFLKGNVNSNSLKKFQKWQWPEREQGFSDTHPGKVGRQFNRYGVVCINNINMT